VKESFVLPRNFGISRLGDIFPAQYHPASFPLHGNYLAIESLVEETKPILSRFRCSYLLHVYNVHERVVDRQACARAQATGLLTEANR
jgi:hypothetical protein